MKTPALFNDNYALKKPDDSLEFREYVPTYHHRFEPREACAIQPTTTIQRYKPRSTKREFVIPTRDKKQ